MKKRLSIALIVLAFTVVAPTYACVDCDPVTGCFTADLDGARTCSFVGGVCETHFVCHGGGARPALASQYTVSAVHVVNPQGTAVNAPPAARPQTASLEAQHTHTAR